MAKTLYQILNAAEAASDNELHQAFKKLEQELSDVHDSASIHRLDRIREAFVILSNPAKRIDYDRKLAASRISSPDTPDIPQQSALSAWLQKPAVLIALVAICALAVYWNIETQKIRQAESRHIAEQQNLANQARELAAQEELDRLRQQSSAKQQDELEARRLEAEQALIQQANENYRSLGEQQLINQAQHSQRALNLMEKQTDMDLRRQELEMAEKKLNLQYRQPALMMDLKQQVQENAAATQQRALQQREANLQSIKDLQAAKRREYERNHYGSGGITTSNPAYEQ